MRASRHSSLGNTVSTTYNLARRTVPRALLDDLASHFFDGTHPAVTFTRCLHTHVAYLEASHQPHIAHFRATSPLFSAFASCLLNALTRIWSTCVRICYTSIDQSCKQRSASHVHAVRPCTRAFVPSHRCACFAIDAMLQMLCITASTAWSALLRLRCRCLVELSFNFVNWITARRATASIGYTAKESSATRQM